MNTVIEYVHIFNYIFVHTYPTISSTTKIGTFIEI